MSVLARANGELEGILAPFAELERIATGASWNEGPVWIPAEGLLRWSDIPGNRILQFDPASGEVATHRTDVEFTNGRTLDLAGNVLQCSHGRRSIEREIAGEVTTLIDSWNGHRLNSPNDIVVASDGSVWFTDPPYGIVQEHEGHPGEREYGDNYVFRFDLNSGLRPAVIDVEEPNGLAFSPDETTLYVTDTSLALNAHGRGNHHIRAYDVLDGQLAKNGRVFAVIEPGVSDGIRVDEGGRVWSSSADSVQIFAPDGRKIGAIAVPEVVGNLCFGGDDGSWLYIAASTSIYRIATSTRDATWSRTVVRA